MRKYAILLLLLIFIIGCDIHRINDDGVKSIIDTVLYNEMNLTNANFEGYGLYLPQGTKIVDKNDYNLKIKDGSYYYYLYVDTIAYHYKTNNEIKLGNNHFYTDRLTNKEYFGYVDISEYDDKFFIVIMYNYAKIEGYVKKNDFQETFINMCNILSSIKYNDKVIDAYIGQSKVISNEEKFDIFSSKREKDNFLTYEKEYEYKTDDEKTQKDEDTLDIQNID